LFGISPLFLRRLQRRAREMFLTTSLIFRERDAASSEITLPDFD
jgi:hypothetical protein